MKKKLLIFIFLMFIFIINATPIWYSNPKKYYDPNEFIVGIGSGNNYEEAISKAKQDLIQQISINVEAVTQTEFSSTETESKSFYTDKVYSAVKTTAEYQLQGMEIMQQEVSKGQNYVMVYINKRRMLSQMLNDLESNWSELQTNLKTAERLKNSGQIPMALEVYSTLQSSLPDYITKKVLYNNLSAKPFTTTESITVSDIEGAVKSLISSIRFEVVNGNQQSGKSGVMLSEAIVFNAYARNSSGEKINLINLPVIISYGDGTFLEKGFTDTLGNYSAFVIAIPERGDRGKIVININPFNFPKYYNSFIRNLSGEAYYKVYENLPIDITVSVSDENGNNLPQTQRQLIRILSANNVFHKDEAELFMRGTAFVRDSQIVEGMGAPKYLVSAELDLEFGIVSSGKVLGSLKGNGKGMSERNESDAKDKAFNNISINSREIKTMLGKVEEFIEIDVKTSSEDNLARGKRFFYAENYQDAIKALLLVKYGEDNIKEAMDLILSAKEKMQSSSHSITTSNSNSTSHQVTRYSITESTDVDSHGFSLNDYIILPKKFNYQESKLSGLVAGMVKTPNDKNEAEFIHHKDNIVNITQFFYATEPATIANIKVNDTVFVFNSFKSPIDREQALNEHWIACRVTAIDNLMQYKVKTTAYYHEIPIEAIRILRK